jgi:hypothetical protein
MQIAVENGVIYRAAPGGGINADVDGVHTRSILVNGQNGLNGEIIRSIR